MRPTAVPLLPLLPLLIAAFVAAARAADGPDADRPDLAEGPRAVPPRAIQLEAGLTRQQLEASPGRGRTLDAVGADPRFGLGLARQW